MLMISKHLRQVLSKQPNFQPRKSVSCAFRTAEQRKTLKNKFVSYQMF